MATGNFRTMKRFPLVVCDNPVSDECYGRMEEIADELNDLQPFFEVKVLSGYYAGVQFYVEEKYCDDIADWEPEDYVDEFGWDKDETLRRFNDAVETIKAKLAEAKEGFDMEELAVAARFDNGAVLYEKVA